MAGSLMFVIYTSHDGKNVTISPRLGTGHDMPLYTGNVGYSILEGSGLINSSAGTNMVANVRCTNCRSWAGGQLNVTSHSQPMIYAVGDVDDQLQTNDYTATIHQHAGYGKFTLDMVAATGTGGIPSDTNQQTGVTHESDQGDGPGPGPGRGLHALFMCGTFLVLFPAGFLFLRLFERLWIHVAFQSAGLFFTLLGAASGIALSIKDNKVGLHPTSPFPSRLNLKDPITDSALPRLEPPPQLPPPSHRPRRPPRRYHSVHRRRCPPHPVQAQPKPHPLRQVPPLLRPRRDRHRSNQRHPRLQFRWRQPRHHCLRHNNYIYGHHPHHGLVSEEEAASEEGGVQQCRSPEFQERGDGTAVCGRSG
jgi:Cytochrome domain of cellobiose dehydrogenase